MASDSEDQDLVAAVSREDTEALGELYDRHCRWMMSLGMRMIGSRSEVEDVLHDVFLEVRKKAHTYSPQRGSVQTWLALRMRSRIIDHIRKHGGSDTESLNSSDEGSSNPAGLVSEESPLDNAVNGQVREKMKELPEKYRRVLDLCYFRGMSIDEIASAVDIPPGTVKSRLFTARQQFREIWAQNPGGLE